MSQSDEERLQEVTDNLRQLLTGRADGLPLLPDIDDPYFKEWTRAGTSLTADGVRAIFELLRDRDPAVELTVKAEGPNFVVYRRRNI